MKFIFAYILFINSLLFILMWLDKRKAKLNHWRISEKTLFLFAIIGGSMGGIIGMYTFRHKTKKLKFTVGLPVILILEIVLVIFLKFM